MLVLQKIIVCLSLAREDYRGMCAFPVTSTILFPLTNATPHPVNPPVLHTDFDATMKYY